MWLLQRLVLLVQYGQGQMQRTAVVASQVVAKQLFIARGAVVS